MCIFCKIIHKELPAKVIAEDERFIAFEDINPVAPVHVLIIPKEHIENFQQIDAETMGEMSDFIKGCATKLGIDRSGYRLVTNIGRNGGQEVMHLHFHLLGGGRIVWRDDNVPRKSL